MRIGMLVMLALSFGWSAVEAAAQLPEPPRRSKDNHFQASQAQHAPLEVMARTWAECLAPHVASCDTEEVFLRIYPPLQNQYSEHAIWRFRQALIELIRDDLHMPKKIFEKSGRALIDGGEGVEHALVEALARRAIRSSGGALAFEKWLGGPGTLQHCHHLVLLRDGPTLARLAKVRSAELAKPQRKAVEELSRKYARELRKALPIRGGAKRKTRFDSHVEDAFATTDGERALTGLRSKLREALRYELTRNAKPGSAAECLELEASLDALVDEHLGEDFWEQLRRKHAEALAAPDGFGRSIRKAELALGE